MKIVLFEVPEEKQSDYIELEKIGAELRFEPEPLSAKNAKDYADADIVSVFICSPLNKETLGQLNNLKYIVTRSAGFDHIDLDYCKEKGIQVSNVASYSDVTVAEHAFALLLNISHNIFPSIEKTRKGDFSREGLTGFDLCGKTFGILGVGRIGAHAARIAKGFGMNVLAYDIVKDESLAKEIGFEYTEFDSLLMQSHVLSLHVPANDKTNKLLNADAFAKMKPGVIIINTARGSIIDTKALLDALDSGKVSAAGLDVLCKEEVLFKPCFSPSEIIKDEDVRKECKLNQVLLQKPNVYVTPHNAFDTKDALQRLVDITKDNIKSFIEGTPKNLVS